MIGLLSFKRVLLPKLVAVKLVKAAFHTNDSAWYRIHKDNDNLTGYFTQIILLPI